MHKIEPFYNWRHLYLAEEDENSPFFGKEHSEFQFTQTVYNYYVHPQWDEFGSSNLYLKVLFVDYEKHYAIIELIGEWNDAVENDIMILKRNLVDLMMPKGIKKYIFIAENVLSFYADDESYYEEWYEELEGKGWVAILNLPEHSMEEFLSTRIQDYLHFSTLDNWRTLKPEYCFSIIDNMLLK